MINLLFPVTSLNDEVKDFFLDTRKRKDVKLFVGVTEKFKDEFKTNAKFPNVKIVVFKDNSKKEEIINGLADYIDKGKMFIVRTPISQKEVDMFVASKTEITFCAPKKRSSVANFFHKLGQKIIKMLFGFTTYDGDVSAIMFGESTSEIIREGKNISYATRVNRWRGYSTSTVEIEGERVKLEYNKKNVGLMLGFWCGLLLLAISGTIVYFLFNEATFLSVFIAICCLFLSSTAVFIAVVITLLKMGAGERYFDKAKEIKIKKEKKNEKTK